MIRHIVLFKFKEDHTAEQLQAAVAELNAIQSKIPEIAAIAHGKNAGNPDAKFDYGMTVDFASKEDYLTYRDHPDHQAMGAIVMAMVANVENMQFEY